MHPASLFKRAELLLCCIVMIFCGGIAQAVSTNDLNSINTDTPFYDPTDTACSDTGEQLNGPNGTGTAVLVPPGQNTGMWNSGIASDSKPILEQFMIELLKDIAKKRGVDPSNAVTQQHVIGLLAFAKGEGGAMTNDNFWNPFNTGLKADDLTVPGKQSSNGSTEVFKSFDAGVEATARVMTGKYQGRLGITLTDPHSSAVDFLSSWLDFPAPDSSGSFPDGHWPWAEASDPSSPYYQKSYKQDHLNLINQVTNSYDSEASIVMRAVRSDPPNPDAPAGSPDHQYKHDTSKLHFHGIGGATSTSPTAGTGPCVTGLSGGGTFFDTAKAYAWPTYHEPDYCLMKPAYAVAVSAALARIGKGQNDFVGGGSSTVSTSASCSGGTAGIDCGGFVTRVFRDSGVDPHYNQQTGGVIQQFAYVMAHPTMYKRLSGIKQTSGPNGLQPGDIYFESDLGHTYIFMGALGYPGFESVSASYSIWRTPMAGGVSDLTGGIWVRPLFSLNAAAATTTGTPATKPTS